MKTKDMAILVVAGIIFVVTGVLAVKALQPKKAAAGKTVQVEVAPNIPNHFDQDGLNAIEDGATNQDFYQRPNLNDGHPNQQFFGTF